MNQNRLAQRIGDFVNLGVACLVDYQLVFHKRGGDDSGKCTVHPYPGSHVWGVVFEINPAQKETLDFHEGVGHGYDAVYKQVLINNRGHNCLLYQAQLGASDDGLRPFDWYKNFVLSGARQNGLPEDYIKMIEKIQILSDSDKNRARLNWQILNDYPL